MILNKKDCKVSFDIGLEKFLDSYVQSGGADDLNGKKSRGRFQYFFIYAPALRINTSIQLFRFQRNYWSFISFSDHKKIPHFL